MKARPPPKSPPPLSTEEMAVIKKRVAPPKGPPPAGLSSFKGPKKYDPDNYNGYGYHEDEGVYNAQDDGKHTRYDISPRNDQDYRRTRNDHHSFSSSSDGWKASSGSPRYREELSHDIHEDPHGHPHGQSRRDDSRDHFNGRRYDDRSSGMREEVPDTKGAERGSDWPSPSAHSPGTREGTRADDKGKRGGKGVEGEECLTSDTKSDVVSVRTGESRERDKFFMFRRVLRASFRDLRTFVTSPCEPKTIVRCYVERNRGGSNYLTPVYSLCADLEDGTGRELITCRKVFKSRSSHYIFSLKTEDLYRKREQRSRMYLGKLRAVSDTEYILFDNGVCDVMPRTNTRELDEETLSGDATHGDDEEEEEEGGGEGEDYGPGRGASQMSLGDSRRSASGISTNDDDSSLCRTHLAVIQYNSRVRPTAENERGMEVCIPHVGTASAVSSQGSPIPSTPPAPKTTELLSCFRRIRETGRQNDLFQSKCFVMHEKRSRYDPLSSCLVDFQGRATIASVKNFQLIHSTPVHAQTQPSRPLSPAAFRADTDIIFQMGKVGQYMS